eukprot:TRINITY_DN20739_c0_g1_i1.p2 TRINITY_DN20739_c0_g1~~TRINITY_DN20739_c0_g1_i1.p2  ORF type:complete len:151 (-),score=7.15 TRINITY_DN20739_c0_g1_i1:4-456(-)
MSTKRDIMVQLFFFFFSSRRRHTRCREVSWARRCVQETGYQLSFTFSAVFLIRYLALPFILILLLVLYAHFSFSNFQSCLVLCCHFPYLLYIFRVFSPSYFLLVSSSVRYFLVPLFPFRIYLFSLPLLPIFQCSSILVFFLPFTPPCTLR